MRINEYYRPASVPERLKSCNRVQTRNTRRRHRPGDCASRAPVWRRCIVDLSGINELKRIYSDSEGLHIGSMATSVRSSGSERTQILPDACKRRIAGGFASNTKRATIGGKTSRMRRPRPTACLRFLRGSRGTRSGRRKQNAMSRSMICSRASIRPTLNQRAILEFVFVNKPDAYMEFEKIGARKGLAISRINLAVALEFDGGAVKKALWRSARWKARVPRR